jgi:hypothetical protein
MSKIINGFFSNIWENRAGLYFHATTGDVLNADHRFGVAPLTMDGDMRFGGAQVILRGFTLEIVFDTQNTNPGPWQDLVSRPSELTIRKNHRQHTIILTWPPGTPEAGLIWRLRAVIVGSSNKGAMP